MKEIIEYVTKKYEGEDVDYIASESEFLTDVSYKIELLKGDIDGLKTKELRDEYHDLLVNFSEFETWILSASMNGINGADQTNEFVNSFGDIDSRIKEDMLRYMLPGNLESSDFVFLMSLYR